MIREANNKPCADCGVRHPYYVMQFDHREDLAKLADVSKMAKEAWSWPKIYAELQKCEVVCANCHAERSYQRLSPSSDIVAFLRLQEKNRSCYYLSTAKNYLTAYRRLYDSA